MKNKIKLLTIFIIILMSFAQAFVSLEVNAAPSVMTTMTDGSDSVKHEYDNTIDPNDYNPDNGGRILPSSKTKIIKKTGIILGTIRNIGVIVAVISIMIIGVKYIIGSVEEKANYKKTLLPYVIGVLMLASGSFIVSIIYNALQ